MKLYETLFILYKCNKAITTTWEVYNQSFDLFKRLPQWQVSMGDYIILEYINFVDEYKTMVTNVEPLYIDRVKLVGRLTKPVRKRIDRWNHLESFRNHFIGHGWRDNGTFVIPDPAVYKVPRNPFEIVQLVLYVKYIWDIVNMEFEKEVNDMLKYMSTLIPKPLPPADYTEINIDLNNMGLEIEAICKQHGKPFPIEIMGFLLPKDE